MRLTQHSAWLAATVALAAAAMTPAFGQSAEPQTAPQAPQPQYACTAPAELTRIDNVLPRTARRIVAGLPLTIVAIGSSSTAGYGASSDATTYPSRLQAELKALFPRMQIKVHNQGVGGEVSRDMLARFDHDVFEAKPDLVIWQVGSNSVLREQPIRPASAIVKQGLGRLKSAGLDVILMNPQYAPKVIAKSNADAMVDLINGIAKDYKTDLFQRFAIMRYWRLTEDMPFSAFLSPDELHQNDWSYACIAKLLAGAIEEAATRPTVTAGAVRR